MFNTIGWLIKVSIFAALVLVLGNHFKWGGKTVSDQVKTQMAKAESLEVPAGVRTWTKGLLGDARKGAHSSNANGRNGPKELGPEEGT